MKKCIVMITVMLLALALLGGCAKSNINQPANSDDVSTTEPVTEPATEPATESTAPESEDDVVYEGDASSYYIDVVYAEQIDRYYTAISQQWNEGAYLENGMSPMVAFYYEGNALDNVGFTFMDLDGDGIWELIIGAIQNAEQSPVVFEIWALKNDEPVMLLQSGSRNCYYLQYDPEAELWSVANEAANGAANHAVYYLQLLEGEFQVTQGVIFDAGANESEPWFMTYDLDWDVSNDDPIDEDLANAIINAGNRLYTATEYFPYSLYK